MSLYRTWRPQTFADLVGQDPVVRTLSSALESGKLAHAYLFSGPRGSGKTSAAKILARCINCVSGPTPHPDNTCENCRAILSGTALDVLEIDAASNRGIDEIRALREAVKFAPATMRMKIYIVDEAHMLTKEGANAFLKTLEEPPPHAVFILATTEPEKLPVTVLSRCQRYAFRRIAIPVMIEKMRAIASGEGIAIDDAALAAIAYRADGGLRDALTMLEQLASYSNGELVTAQTLDLAFGSTGRERAEAIAAAIVDGDAAAALAAVEEANDAGADVTVLTRSLIAYMRHLLVAKVDPKLLATDLAPDDAQRVAERAKPVSQALLVGALRTLSEALALARSGGNARLELESALLRIILSGEDPSLEALAARVGALEHNAPTARAIAQQPARSAPPPAPVPPPAAPEGASAPARRPAPPDVASATHLEPGQLSIQKIRAGWQSVRGKVESERQPLRMPLSRAAIESLESNAVVLRLPDTWSADALKDHLPLLERAIAEVFGVALRVTLRVDAPGGRPKNAEPTPGSEPSGEGNDPDALFDYANERIR